MSVRSDSRPVSHSGAPSSREIITAAMTNTNTANPVRSLSASMILASIVPPMVPTMLALVKTANSVQSNWTKLAKLAKPANDFMAITSSEVPIARFMGRPPIKASAGTTRNPPPAPTKPVTAPTTTPSSAIFGIGRCAGAGAILAMASDLRLGTARSKVAFLFVRVGLAGADMGACNILPRIIGAGRAAELLYTGRAMDGAEAERIGFYNRLCEPDAVLTEAQTLAQLCNLEALSACGLDLRKDYDFPDATCPAESPLSEFDALLVADKPEHMGRRAPAAPEAGQGDAARRAEPLPPSDARGDAGGP